MSKKIILFLSGVSDDTNAETFNEYGEGKRSDLQGNLMLYPYLADTDFQKMHILLSTDEKQQVTLPEFDAVFNLISEADTHKTTLAKVDSLYHSLGDKTPFINAPKNILKTSKTVLYALLANIQGLQIAKTVLLEPGNAEELKTLLQKEQIDYPAILKPNDGSGAIALLRDEKGISDTLPFYSNSLYATAFIPYMLNEYYRKERLLVIDGEVFLADVQFSETWYIDEASKIDNAETLAMRRGIAKRFREEIQPSIQPAISAIYEKTGLEYFILDCHIDMEKNIHLFSFNPDAAPFAVDENHPCIEELTAAHEKLVTLLKTKAGA